MIYYDAKTPQNYCVARVNFSSPNTFLRSGARLESIDCQVNLIDMESYHERSPKHPIYSG